MKDSDKGEKPAKHFSAAQALEAGAYASQEAWLRYIDKMGEEGILPSHQAIQAFLTRVHEKPLGYTRTQAEMFLRAIGLEFLIQYLHGCQAATAGRVPNLLAPDRTTCGSRFRYNYIIERQLYVCSAKPKTTSTRIIGREDSSTTKPNRVNMLILKKNRVNPVFLVVINLYKSCLLGIFAYICAQYYKF